jgi:hypothetical protein
MGCLVADAMIGNILLTKPQLARYITQLQVIGLLYVLDRCAADRTLASKGQS